MENFSGFNRQIEQIHNTAKIIIEKKPSKADWPALVSNPVGENEVHVSFSKPAIIWNAPLRGSSNKSTAKRSIIIDGSFFFKNNIFDKGSASLEVYEIPRENLNLKLVQAMHFDIEPHATQSPFHPMFHVQFGQNNHWDFEALKQRISILSNSPVDRIAFNRDLTNPTRDVRIPTPQMDYLSVLVMVIADYFCDKESTHDVKASFKNLLTKVMHSNNLARKSRQATALENRWLPPHTHPFCASHWYEEGFTAT